MVKTKQTNKNQKSKVKTEVQKQEIYICFKKDTEQQKAKVVEIYKRNKKYDLQNPKSLNRDNNNNNCKKRKKRLKGEEKKTSKTIKRVNRNIKNNKCFPKISAVTARASAVNRNPSPPPYKALQCCGGLVSGPAVGPVGTVQTLI